MDEEGIQGDTTVQAFLSLLQGGERRIAQRLINGRVSTAAVLRDRILAYRDSLNDASFGPEFLDIDTASRAIDLCLRLVDQMDDLNSRDAHRVIQAAVEYLILDADAESDSHSIIGFDDDLRVAQAAAAAVGLSGSGERG